MENLVERRVCDERLKKLKRNYKGETILHQAAIKGDSDSIFHLLYRERKSKYFQKCLVDIEDNAGMYCAIIQGVILIFFCFKVGHLCTRPACGEITRQPNR